MNEEKNKEENQIVNQRSLKRPFSLDGLKALVTGASRGIGKEIAIALAEAGANVAINYRSSEDGAAKVAQRIEELGVSSWIYPADISDYDETVKMKNQIDKYFGKIDILVNNAGVNVDKMFVKMDQEAWSKVISVNLNGVFNCCNVFKDDLLESNQGRIINITSIVGQMGNIGQVNYAASKAGIIGLTKALAKEFARKGITVNAVAPGFIATDMLMGVPDKVKDRILVQIPANRFGRPDEVAHAVTYLASREAAYVTGHILNINGGMYV
ncbi:3-oxoacyl-[acyl-carrier-protein] reductase [[Eubacterium] cellulosolvens]